jgi:uncharacterized NAD(P)/FAD-binding protein YdhS
MRIAIVGGGATGALAAVHIARRLLQEDVDIAVIEPSETLGRGLAYSTRDPRHLLNVRVANMSAFPDEPQHLHAWLQRKRGARSPTPFSFISRSAYGDYVNELAREALASGGVRHVRDSCVDLVEGPSSVTLSLASGDRMQADRVILATGHDPKPGPDGFPSKQPWSPYSLDGLSPDGPILIIGSGLTMIDLALSLDRRGHRGPIVAVSRRGLLPTAHRPTAPRAALLEADVPFGADLSRLVQWLRRLAAQFTLDGADWRSAVDALRPYTQRLWREMSLDQKRRFLRHARAYWEVHRHRMAPEIEDAMQALMRSGRLELIAGRIVEAEKRADGVYVRISRRGAQISERWTFERVIDCTGLAENPLKSSNPLLSTLFARGALRPDALGIGLDVTENYAIVDARGAPSPRVQVIGPLARAAFWECIAIPDIRVQCRDVAEGMAQAVQRRAANQEPAGQVSARRYPAGQGSVGSSTC